MSRIRKAGRHTRKRCAGNGDTLLEIDVACPALDQKKSSATSVSAAKHYRPHVKDKRRRACVYLAITLSVVFVIGAVLPTNLFSPDNFQLSPAWWFGVLQSNIAAFASFFLAQHDVASTSIMLAQRVVPPIAGAALGLSGAIYQGSLKNALASPSTLGVMGGASLGITVYALFFMNVESNVDVYSMGDLVVQAQNLAPWENFIEMQLPALFAIIGALAVAAIVLGIALIAGRGRMSGVALIITGQVVMTLISSINMLVRYWIANTATDSPQSLMMRYLQISKLGSTAGWTDVLVLAIPTIICIAILIFLAPRLNLLAFGEDEARTMGVNTNRLRVVSVCLVTLLTAIVVACCGSIGFIGFFIPHLMRRIVGPDMRYLMPASALGGAMFLMLAYDLVSIYDTSALPSIGIITAAIGGIAFFAVIIKQKGTSDGWE